MTTKHTRDMTPAEYAAAVAGLDELDELNPLEEQYRQEDAADRLEAAPTPAASKPKRVADMTEHEYAAAKAALDD